MTDMILILTQVLRVLSPVFIGAVVIWCAVSLLREKKLDYIYATLVDEGSGICFPVRYLECSLGRSASCDILLELPTVSRVEAVLRHTKEGFRVFRLGKGEIAIGGKPVRVSGLLKDGDTLTVGGLSFSFSINDRVETGVVAKRRGSFLMLLLLSVYELLTGYVAIAGVKEELVPSCAMAVLLLVLSQWGYFLYAKLKMHQIGLEFEIGAFTLCGIGICNLITAGGSGVITQMVAYLIGLVGYCVVLWFCGDTDRTTKYRYLASAAALVLFALNLALGSVRGGSKNWIVIGSFQFQPSELVKMLFIFAGAATLERLLSNRNLLLFLVFSTACIGSLFLMGDFGTAVIFFVTFMVIAYMRSGDIRAIALILAVAVLGALLIINFKPYIVNRFETWGHAFDFADDRGYQQSRTLVAVASGGLIGTGIGVGRLRYVVASTTDLVFGMVAEQWGMIVGVLILSFFAVLCCYAIKMRKGAKSAFYAITACASAALLLFQATLNTFGALDVLPFTGVTLPFISRGGSSMISSFALLAFIKTLSPSLYSKRRRVAHENDL